MLLQSKFYQTKRLGWGSQQDQLQDTVEGTELHLSRTKTASTRYQFQYCQCWLLSFVQ